MCSAVKGKNTALHPWGLTKDAQLTHSPLFGVLQILRWDQCQVASQPRVTAADIYNPADFGWLTRHSRPFCGPGGLVHGLFGRSRLVEKRWVLQA